MFAVSSSKKNINSKMNFASDAQRKYARTACSLHLQIKTNITFEFLYWKPVYFLD